MATQLWSKMKEGLPPDDVRQPEALRSYSGRYGADLTKVEKENRVCAKCGDTGFITGVLMFERGYVIGVLCHKCLNKLARLL